MVNGLAPVSYATRSRQRSGFHPARLPEPPARMGQEDSAQDMTHQRFPASCQQSRPRHATRCWLSATRIGRSRSHPHHFRPFRQVRFPSSPARDLRFGWEGKHPRPR